MSKEFARQFYSSRAWANARRAYKKSVGGLCERCMAKGIISSGDIVHHKIHLTPANINRPEIVLSWSNLECVCRDCHAQEHGLGRPRRRKRYIVDELGRVAPLPEK